MSTLDDASSVTFTCVHTTEITIFELPNLLISSSVRLARNRETHVLMLIVIVRSETAVSISRRSSSSPANDDDSAPYVH